jgi:glyoxylase-like metal-dependent hydrolase (beta-lactamase superfamily II)
MKRPHALAIVTSISPAFTPVAGFSSQLTHHHVSIALYQYPPVSSPYRSLARTACFGKSDGEVDGEEEPPQNWLQSLKKEADETTGRLAKPLPSTDADAIPDLADFAEGDMEPGNVNIPSTGVSVSDSLVDSQKDEYTTSLKRVGGLAGVAKIETESSGIIEPTRYLVVLSPPQEGENDEEKAAEKYALVDVPPYSDELAKKMRSFMGKGGRLANILVTNRDSLHYDESPAVYVTRKSDMAKWQVAFPGAKIVMYRLDIPRECRDVVSQRLDGYGPWALDEGSDGTSTTFVESGRPLTVMEWDEGTRSKVMDDGEDPPDDEEEGDGDDELYTPAAIRQREEGKRILAIYTPGRTFGSVSYVFPDTGVCCSGYSIPIEDARVRQNMGMSAGPKLDYSGYVTTSVAGVRRQAESARELIQRYSDRFTTVLPANGETVELVGDAEYRSELLLDLVAQYEKIGKIYGEMGIM